MQRLFVLDYTRGYLPTLLLASAAYAREGGDALLIDPARDAAIVAAAIDRFHPAEVLAMNGLPPGAQPDGYGPVVRTLPAEMPAILSYLVAEELHDAPGAVLFPAHSPSWAIKAAALAARRGYIAWPVEEAAGFALAAPPGVEVLVVGEAPGNLQDSLHGRPWRHLAGDRAIAAYLAQQAGGVDYVIQINSADLQPPGYHEEGLAGCWTPGLSLLAPILASFRPALVLDARSPRPDARSIEATLNQKVRDVDLHPRYLCILASPGAVPFIHEPLIERADGAEEPTRDLHLRLDDDLFFDCAEGRIYALSTGRAALQVLTVRHYASLQGDWRERALLAAAPHRLNQPGFAEDEALVRTQLDSLTRAAGLQPVTLTGRDCRPERLAAELAGSGLFFCGGRATQLELSTHGRGLLAEDLPDLPPLVAYASACSTLRPRPFLTTADGGYSFSSEPVPAGEVIGLAFVERGAVAFVGALTSMGGLFRTPMCEAFFQAMLLRGEPLGEALRAARNAALLQAQLLNQHNRAALRPHKRRLAESVGQLLLLGDPAFAPYAGVAGAPSIIAQVAAQDETLTATVAVPDAFWQRRTVAEAGGPVHLWADLPAGRAAVAVLLEQAELTPPECLACGRPGLPPDDPVGALNRFSLPLRAGQPPVPFDCSAGWPFAVEERRGGGLRIHWLVPAAVLHERAGTAMRLRRAQFRIVLAPAVRVEGRLDPPAGLRLPANLLITVAAPGRDGTAVAQGIADADGRFRLRLPAGEWPVRVGAPFPVYDFGFHASPGLRLGGDVRLSVSPDREGALVSLRLEAGRAGTLLGTVVDLATGKALENAAVRVWQGGRAGGHSFANALAAELRTDPVGRFRVDVPAGEYLVTVHNRNEHSYFPAEAAATVHAGRTTPVVLALEPGAIVRGRVTYQGPVRPRRAQIRVTEPEGRPPGAIHTGTVRRSGAYEVLVPTGRPFALSIHPEGFRAWRDDQGGQGFWLAAGEVLECDITLEPDPEEA